MECQLPCACGASVTAKLGDAGSELVCGCGQKVPVPKYSEFRKLIEIPVENPQLARRRLVMGRLALAALGAMMLVSDSIILTQLRDARLLQPGVSVDGVMIKRAVGLIFLFGLAMSGYLWARFWLILGLIVSCLHAMFLLMVSGLPVSFMVFSAVSHLAAIFMLIFIRTNDPRTVR